jgi:mRNA-degrading endonuclease HigB of HigAB toxin-antitoxin module
VQIDFDAQVVYVKKVMTHAEYCRKNGYPWKKSCNC